MRHEYAIFNKDRELICAGNGVSSTAEEWAWLYTEPVAFRYDEQGANKLVAEMNAEREDEGQLETYGPYFWRRRTITYGEWE